MLLIVEVIKYTEFKERIRIVQKYQRKYKGCKIKVCKRYVQIDRFEEEI